MNRLESLDVNHHLGSYAPRIHRAAPATEILITEHQVVFATAVAALAPPSCAHRSVPTLHYTDGRGPTAASALPDSSQLRRTLQHGTRDASTVNADGATRIAIPQVPENPL
jgi:hypothetical protein